VFLITIGKKIFWWWSRYVKMLRR